MRLPNALRRLLCAALALTLTAVASGAAGLLAGASSYQSQIAELEQKQSALRSQIAELQDDIDEQEALKEALQEQIDTVQRQIDLYNAQIDDLQDKIDDLEDEKAEREADLEKRKNTFLARIRAMYLSGGDTALTVLLSADDFADYLYQSELLATVTEYDNREMDQLRLDIDEIAAIEEEVAAEQAEVESLKASVDEKRAELNENMKTLDAVIDKLQEKQNDLQFDVDQYQEQIDALEEKIAAAAEAAREQSVEESIHYDGSQFIWPTPGFYYISSNYGYRWGRLHKGCDIAGSNIYGTPIVAAADGVVSLVDYNDGGYGYYVMINHGNSDGDNYVTRYGHMSAQAAYEGQHVSAGDVIGYVGSTGRSTGPHCHFEIRVNGSAQNPLNFFNSVG